VYPLDDHGSGVASVGDITPVVGTIVPGNYQVVINNIASDPFSVVIGDTAGTIVDKMVIAVNAVSSMPVIASDSTTKLTLTSKWKGVSANGIVINEVSGPTSGGVTWTIVQPASGATNPTVDSALAQFGNTWETLVINALDTADTTALATIGTFNDGRWGATVLKPFACFTGAVEATVDLAKVVPETRKTDKTNVFIPSPASKDLPCVIAARAVAEIAVVANDNPAQDYGLRRLTGLTPGATASEWDYAMRQAALLAGVSSVEIVDNEVRLSDVVTFYHPTGDDNPAYRYVCDLVKLWNVMNTITGIFRDPSWAGAPLIPDEQPTVNPTAKKPKMAKAAIAAKIDGLGLEAVISDPAFSKASIQTGINGTNPKRLDCAVTVKLSGNTNIISVDLFFGFYFGQSVVVG